jgi:hypothetical protein
VINTPNPLDVILERRHEDGVPSSREERENSFQIRQNKREEESLDSETSNAENPVPTFQVVHLFSLSLSSSFSEMKDCSREIEGEGVKNWIWYFSIWVRFICSHESRRGANVSVMSDYERKNISKACLTDFEKDYGSSST